MSYLLTSKGRRGLNESQEIDESKAMEDDFIDYLIEARTQLEMASNVTGLKSSEGKKAAKEADKMAKSITKLIDSVDPIRS